MITENLSTLKINKLTNEQFKRAKENGIINQNELYLTPDNTLFITVVVGDDESLSASHSLADITEHIAIGGEVILVHRGYEYTLCGAGEDHSFYSFIHFSDDQFISFVQMWEDDTLTESVISLDSLENITNHMIITVDDDDNLNHDFVDIYTKAHSGGTVVFTPDYTTWYALNYYSEDEICFSRNLWDTGEMQFWTIWPDNTVNYTSFTPSSIGRRGAGIQAEIFNYNSNTAAGDYSHAEGYSTKALSAMSHAEGTNTIANHESSHAEGYSTSALGKYSHTEGYAYTSFVRLTGEANSLTYTITSNETRNFTDCLLQYQNVFAQVLTYNKATQEITVDTSLSATPLNDTQVRYTTGGYATGNGAHTEGYHTIATGHRSHAEGNGTYAAGDNQHTQGTFNIIDKPGKDAVFAHIVGNGLSGDRSNAHTLDWDGNAWYQGNVYVGSRSGKYFDEGSKKLATEEYITNTVPNLVFPTMDEKLGTKIDTINPTATGSFSLNRLSTSEIGEYSVSAGYKNTASGESSHAEGNFTHALAAHSHTEGDHTETTAEAIDAHVEGLYTYANRPQQHVQGRYNSKADTNYIHIVGGGNGDTEASRKNIHTISDNGNAWFAGDIRIGANTYSAGEEVATKTYVTEELNNLSTTAPEALSALETIAAQLANNNDAVTSLVNTLATKPGVVQAKQGEIFNDTGTNEATGTSSHAEGRLAKAKGNYSHAEGNNSTAEGTGAHAEGQSRAMGNYSHSEGVSNGELTFNEQIYQTGANGIYSHNEGYQNVAQGNCSHAEGSSNCVIGSYAHAEGYANVADSYNHVEGENNIGISRASHAEGKYNKIGSVYTSADIPGTVSALEEGYGHAEGFGNVITKTAGHAEGQLNLVSGRSAHAEGERTVASGIAAHAEGYSNRANGSYVHAEGQNNRVGAFTFDTTTGNYIPNEDSSTTHSSHAEGNNNYVFASAAHAEGMGNVVNATASHAEGYQTRTGAFDLTEMPDGSKKYIAVADNKSTGTTAHAEGSGTWAQNSASHAEGYWTQAFGSYSHSEGEYTIAAKRAQHVQGKYNLSENAKDYAHIVGNGTAEDEYDANGALTKRNRSNAHTIDWQGNAWYQGAVTSSGADYAEFFEWADGNPGAVDYVGYVVALDGEKIRLAQADDKILGIISGTAAILGDNAECAWKNKYMTDKFGRIIYDMVEEFITDVDIETGEEIKTSAGFFPHPRLNPAYDASQTYIPRENRPEWAKVGMLGKIHTLDDGTCVPGGYGKVGADGMLTNSEVPTNLYIMKRTSNDVVLVLLK